MKLAFTCCGLLLILAIVILLSALDATEGFEDATVSGRYIRLQQDQVGCLNLAEIRAYSYKGGPNLITPQTAITKSSIFAGDPGPSHYFSDRNVDTILHTSCGDAPWVLVDLGMAQPIYKIHIVNRKDCCINRANGIILSLLDEQKKPIYIAQPIKDKKGRVTYVESSAEVTNMTDYFKTFTWYPPKPECVGDGIDEDDIPVNMQCRTASTSFEEDGGGNLIYLDRQRVFCGPDEVMNGFHLNRESAQFPGKVRYSYTCCKMGVPREPPQDPSRFVSLETAVQDIKKSLQASATPASATSATSASASPVREDVVPITTLSNNSLDAVQMGLDSSFLRDIQGIIRNEIQSQRAFTAPGSEE